MASAKDALRRSRCRARPRRDGASSHPRARQRRGRDARSPRASAAPKTLRFRRTGDAAHAARFKPGCPRADALQRRPGALSSAHPVASRPHNGAALLIARSATSALASRGLGADGAITKGGTTLCRRCSADALARARADHAAALGEAQRATVRARARLCAPASPAHRDACACAHPGGCLASVPESVHAGDCSRVLARSASDRPALNRALRGTSVSEGKRCSAGCDAR
jgi:hypothetical protein